MKKENKENKSFNIPVSICRLDLKWQGYDIENITDKDMEELAHKMGKAYISEGYHADIDALANALGFSKRQND